MRKNGTSSDSGDGGFSLVEILIVIVVLGILATITVFAVRGVTDRGEQATCDEDRRIVQTAVETYFAQWGGDEILTTEPTSPTPTGDMAAAIANGDISLGADAEATLVGFGFLSANSELYDADTAGAVAPDGGSRC